MKKSLLFAILLAISLGFGTAWAGTPSATYYYVAPGLGQPYCYDMHLGFKYAAEKFGVEIIRQGSDDWNSQTACEALEQIVAKKPAGIITVAWDAAMNPGIKKAQAAGIPIILVEAESGDFGDCYIGLDNVDAGRETADQLIKYGGNSGKVLVIGNWGSTNIDQKFIGLKEVLAKTGWQIVGDQDGECEAEASLRAAKDLLNNHPEATAFVGLDSACGAAIGTAMEELGIAPGKLTVVVADREDAMLDYVRSGHIQASLTNRTAMMCYLAVQFLENITKFGFFDIPVTSNNQASKISVWPRFVFTGNVVISKENVDNFDHAKMSSYDTPLYH
ncbi:MAG: substrate-binding domain-containing protein [Planctomycetota bacterium]|jgi:ribose transport system substrate-binding protein|nr:substrate-binding domain-containing protein [Planctomycetota bacterium]